MKAGFLYGMNDLRIKETEMPEINNQEILVKVKAAAICGTDIRMHKNGYKDVIRDAKAADSTRAVFAMRKAQKQGLLDGAIIGIGNAPTALLEVIRMIREESVRPALIIGMPVGFVSAAESKDLLKEMNNVPWIITQGRKGGSTLVVAAVHALLALAEQTQKTDH